MLSTLTGVLALGMLYFLLRTGWYAWRAISINAGIDRRRPDDISHLGLPPPPELQPTVAALPALGFRRLGETSTPLPIGPRQATSWLFVDAGNTTTVEAVPVGKPPMVGFQTVYADEAVVETIYPMGERIDDPHYRSHTVTASIEAAYRHHAKQAADFATAHGAPQRIESMADAMHWDAVFRRRYARRRGRRLYLTNLASLCASVYAAVAAVAVLLRPGPGPAPQAWIGRLHTLFDLLMPALFVLCLSVCAAVWGSRRNAPDPPGR